MESETPAPYSLKQGPTAEQERLRFEGDLDKWMKIIGASVTGYQPEAYALMDLACNELVKLRCEVDRTVPIDLMQRIWANLYYDEHEAGGTFQSTLNDVVDWLSSRGALPDVATEGQTNVPPLLKRMSDLLDDLSPEDTIGYTNGAFWIDVATVEEIRKAAYPSPSTQLGGIDK